MVRFQFYALVDSKFEFLVLLVLHFLLCDTIVTRGRFLTEMPSIINYFECIIHITVHYINVTLSEELFM